MSSPNKLQAPSSVRYSRVLRLAWAVAIGASISVGVGIYILPGMLIQASGGRGLGTAFVLLAIGSVPLILTYAERAAVLSGSGGPYALARAHNQLTLTFATGWVLLGGYASLIAVSGWGVAIHANLLLEVLFNHPATLAWLSAFSIIVAALMAVSGSPRTWINRGRYVYASIVVLCVFIVRYLLGPAPVTDPSLVVLRLLDQNTATIVRVAALMVAGLWGIAFIIASRDEIRRPTRTLPRAMGLVVGIQCLLGILAIVTIMRYPAALRNSLTPLAEVAGFVGGRLDMILVILYAISGILITGVALTTTIVFSLRLLGTMIHDGFLPDHDQSPDAALTKPPVIFLFLVIGSIVLVTLLPTMTLIGLAALTFLWTAALVHVPDLFRPAPDLPVRRRLKLPFHPLFPGLTVAIGILLPLSLPSGVVWYGIIWGLLGALWYIGYAGRSGRAVYRHAVIVGNVDTSVTRTGAYRVLVVMPQEDTAASLIRMAAQLARSDRGSLLVLKVLVFAAQTPFHVRRRLAQREWETLNSMVHSIDAGGVPIQALVRIAPGMNAGILETVREEAIALLVLNWAGREQTAEGQGDPFLDSIIRRGTCDTVIVRGVVPSDICHMLVATAGGPHAPLALAVGQALASAKDCQIKLLHVANPHSEAANQDATIMPATLKAAQQVFRPISPLVAEPAQQNPPVVLNSRTDLGHDGSLATMLMPAQVVTLEPDAPAGDSVTMTPQVLSSADVTATLLAEAATADLLLMGASKEGFLEQTRFRGLPVDVSGATSTPIIIARRHETGGKLYLQRFLELLSDILPTLTVSRRAEVYQDMRVAAQPSVDFFVLITLAATIASLGLIQNSAAVIIGAMLVAPLMSPILAMAMSIVQGDVRMLGTAAEATVQGIALAVIVGVTMTILSPMQGATGEILARTQPNILDLLVAIASGAAAGYALSRKEVAAALPGVAIAAALVPPLCVVGFGLATSHLDITIGASLLFITNLVAIVFAAAIVFMALGFHPERTERQDVLRRLRFTIVSLGVVFLVLLYSSALTLIQVNRQLRIEDIFTAALLERSAEVRDMTLDRVGKGFQINATVIAYDENRLTPDQLTELQHDLSEAVGAPVLVNATIIQGSRKSLTQVTRESRAAELFASLVDPEQAQVERINIRSQSNRLLLTMTVVTFGDNAVPADLMTTLQSQLSTEFGVPVAIDATIMAGQRSKLAIPTPTPIAP